MKRSRLAFAGFSLLLATLEGVSQTNPPKLAALARFDLMADTSVGSIDDGRFALGSGSLERQNWRPASEQPRSYFVHAPVVHFDWTAFAFRFVPRSNGTVRLSLMGPWEQSPGGPIYRQEIFWDSCTAVGATLPNGSFESASGGVPAGWTRPAGDGIVVTGAVPAAEGQQVLRVWHDGPMDCTFGVRAGEAVTLRFFARAAVPANYTDMRRITDTNSPAHQAARRFMRGINLSGYLEAFPGTNPDSTYTANDFAAIRAEGFDHVRLPIAWHHYTGPAPGFLLPSTIFTKVDFLVTNALQHGLNVIIDIHNFDPLTSNPPAHTNRFYSLWRQIAAHYVSAPSAVALELLNEPRDAATTTLLNPIYAEVIRQIRQIDAARTLFVGPGDFNGLGELHNLKLPDDDNNVIATVHCYDPLLFTHQGAAWAFPLTATVGIAYPGPPAAALAASPTATNQWVIDWIRDYNDQPAALNPCSRIAFEGRLRIAKQWSDYYGRPVHLGEFGCYTQAAAGSRAAYCAEIRAVTDGLGIGWALWDWKSDFRYWDTARQQPVAGMREALFPQPRLISPAAGVIELDGAVAKTVRIDRAFDLTGPQPWIPLATQTFARPRLQFADPPAAGNNSGFYRVEWLK